MIACGAAIHSLKTNCTANIMSMQNTQFGANKCAMNGYLGESLDNVGHLIPLWKVVNKIAINPDRRKGQCTP